MSNEIRTKILIIGKTSFKSFVIQNYLVYLLLIIWSFH